MTRINTISGLYGKSRDALARKIAVALNSEHRYGKILPSPPAEFVA